MSVLVAILLGLIQGTATFLPISYSGHQAILQNVFKLTEAETGDGFFKFLMNLSVLVSILMVYRRDLAEIFSDAAEFIRGRHEENPVTEGRLSPRIRMLYAIFIGTVPLILTTAINQRAGLLLGNSIFVGSALLVMGGIMFATDKLVKTGKKNEKTINTKDALFVGLAQAIAVIPGLSRTGTTVAIGLTRGFGKDFAVRFAVFLALPSIVVSILSSFFSIFRSGIDWPSIFSYLIGFVVAVLSGYISILVLRLMTAKRKLRNFSYYLWFIGVLLIVLNFIL